MNEFNEKEGADVTDDNGKLADKVVASRILHHSFSCSNPKDTGHTCVVSPSTNYWYNPSTGICEQFTFKGCGGNSNNFVSYTACTDRCDTKTSSVCKMLKDVGSCRGHRSMFYYNKYKGQCEPFRYSGCGGNLNRFRTAFECQAKCGGSLYEKPIPPFIPQPLPPVVYPPPVRQRFNFIFSIDFSGSTQSLHNQGSFAKAIQALGNIIQKYDVDNHFPALGFGATKLGDAFLLTGGCCNGISGVLSAYRAITKRVQYGAYDPYAPSIKKATEMARRDPHHHTVLLLVSDIGSTHPNQAIQAMITASEVPMSIVLIALKSGSGSAGMKKFDSDGKLLSYNGRTARRDVVQYVDITQYYGNPFALEKQLFAEVPQWPNGPYPPFNGYGPYNPYG